MQPNISLKKIVEEEMEKQFKSVSRTKDEDEVEVEEVEEIEETSSEDVSSDEVSCSLHVEVPLFGNSAKLMCDFRNIFFYVKTSLEMTLRVAPSSKACIDNNFRRTTCWNRKLDDTANFSRKSRRRNSIS